MAVYVTGDMHGYANRFSFRNFPFGRTLTKSDFIIVAGDFGLVWDGSPADEFWLDWLDERPWTTLFVDGNHENFDLLNAYPVEEWNGGKVHKIRPSVIHLMRGQVYGIDGKKFFTFGGASSVDREERKEGKSWWAREIPNRSEFEEALENLARHGNSVDFIITHTCPTSVLPHVLGALGHEPRPRDPVNEYLEYIRRHTRYGKWYFGHFHGNVSLPDNMQLVYNTVLRAY